MGKLRTGRGKKVHVAFEVNITYVTTLDLLKRFVEAHTFITINFSLMMTYVCVAWNESKWNHSMNGFFFIQWMVSSSIQWMVSSSIQWMVSYFDTLSAAHLRK